MRAVILAALTAGAIGLYGTSVSAAPANGIVIGQSAAEFKPAEVWWRRRWRYRWHYRWRWRY
jgi:hypothetical protein